MVRLSFKRWYSLLLLVMSIVCQPTSAPVATTLPLTVTAPTPQPTSRSTPLGSTILPTPLARPTVSLTPLASPTRPAVSRDRFVYTGLDGSLMLQDPTAREVKLLLQATSKDFYDAPSFSPDGSHIVFVYTTFVATDKPSNEIRTVTVDGSSMQTLFKAPTTGPQVYFSYPRYSSDGTLIYFSIVVTGATLRESKFQIVRAPASGGEWTIMLEDGYMPHFSLDGQRVTFLRANPQTFYTSLWVANANGTSARLLVADDVFLEVTGPHISPDGQWIVFAASGPPQKKLPTAQLPFALNRQDNVQSERDSCAIWFLFVCLGSRAHANGLPWELWLVSMEGKSFKQLTQLQLDSPWPAFSRNGRYVGFMTFEGTFEYDRETNRVTKLSTEGGHGVIDWFQD